MVALNTPSAGIVSVSIRLSLGAVACDVDDNFPLCVRSQMRS